jgi:integrase/recombinase XerC
MLQYDFKRVAKAAGLDSHYSIHCLRHTYATHLLKAGKYNLRLVQEQLGHSSVKVTEVYTKLIDADVSAAVERLYGR